MAQRYEDGGDLPYRILYNRPGTVARSQELRFSDAGLARDEIEKLIRRGHSVDYAEWDHVGRCYITKDAYN